MKSLVVSLLLSFVCYTANSQCFTDRHNTSWNSAWISCDRTGSPNPIRGNSHWLRLNLNQIYSLGQITFWNYNDPENLDRGLQEIVIDYSLDGENWEEWGTVTIDQAEGSGFYEGVDGPDLEGLTAKDILITGLSNYGDNCFALSELKIEVLELVSDLAELEDFELSISPNPTSSILNLELSAENVEGDLKYTIVDLLGRNLQNGIINTGSNKIVQQIDVSFLNPGQYFLELHSARSSSSKAFTKINP